MPIIPAFKDEAGGSVQVQLWLHREFKASMSYLQENLSAWKVKGVKLENIPFDKKSHGGRNREVGKQRSRSTWLRQETS